MYDHFHVVVPPKTKKAGGHVQLESIAIDYCTGECQHNITLTRKMLSKLHNIWLYFGLIIH